MIHPLAIGKIIFLYGELISMWVICIGISYGVVYNCLLREIKRGISPVYCQVFVLKFVEQAFLAVWEILRNTTSQR